MLIKFHHFKEEKEERNAAIWPLGTGLSGPMKVQESWADFAQSDAPTGIHREIKGQDLMGGAYH